MPLRYESNLMKPSARLAGLLSDGITEEKKTVICMASSPYHFRFAARYRFINYAASRSAFWFCSAGCAPKEAMFSRGSRKSSQLFFCTGRFHERRSLRTFFLVCLCDKFRPFWLFFLETGTISIGLRKCSDVHAVAPIKWLAVKRASRIYYKGLQTPTEISTNTVFRSGGFFSACHYTYMLAVSLESHQTAQRVRMTQQR